jgi:hypothetical protein
MDDLLKLAIEAHGGLEHWREFNVVRANASITGALWHLKGQADVLNNAFSPFAPWNSPSDSPPKRKSATKSGLRI